MNRNPLWVVSATKALSAETARNRQSARATDHAGESIKDPSDCQVVFSAVTVNQDNNKPSQMPYDGLLFTQL